MCDVQVYNASMQSFIIFCYGNVFAFVTEQQTNYISQNIEYSLH